jgi:glycosyltransferase involved in cell wall biosynthesis
MIIFQFSFGDGFAGSAKVALLSSKLLREKGHRVIIFVSQNSLTRKRAGEYGLEVISLDDKQKYKLLLKEINKHFISIKPGIVIGHHSLDRKIGISLKRKHPEVINIAYRHNITKSFPFIGSFIYNRYTDKLIACSKGVAESLTNSGIKGNKVEVIYNGISIPPDLENISGKSVREKFIPNGKFVIGLSTWFHKERKGFDILFQAFTALNQNYILLLVGIPENQKNEVLSYANEFNISPEKIVMPGYVENIWEYYKAMDIFLLPSRSEGFSLALLEAGAAGLTIIASDIPGNNEFIKDHYNGLLFSISNPKELPDKISEITNNKELAANLGIKAREDVYSKYTIEMYSENLDKFLSELIIQ